VAQGERALLTVEENVSPATQARSPRPLVGPRVKGGPYIPKNLETGQSRGDTRALRQGKGDTGGALTGVEKLKMAGGRGDLENPEWSRREQTVTQGQCDGG